MSDPMQAIIEAEGLVRARKMERESLQRDYRSPMALEMIADEMTLLRAEVRTLRYLFATYAARPRESA